MPTLRFQFIILNLIAITFLSACGSDKSPSGFDGQSQYNGPGPRGDGTTGTLPPSPAGTDPVLSECNQFEITSIGLTGKARTFYDVSGNYDINRIRIRVQTLPTEFVSGTGRPYIEFYRWMVSSSGAVSIDPTPLNFTVVIRSTGIQAGTFGSAKFDRDAFQKIQTDFSTSSDINDYDFIVSGTAQNYQALQVAVKRTDGSATDEVMGNSNFLIPAFQSNPNSYAAGHNPVLAGIHPFASRTNEGWTSDQYKSMSDSQFCVE